MRIDAYNQVSQLYKTNSKPKVQQTGNLSGSDKVEISSFGKDIQIAKQAVKNASDVREDKVAEIKNSIAKGTYNVSYEDFAEKLVQRFENAVR